MSLQIATVDECGRTHVTFVRPGAGVNSFMNQQFARAGETFAAITAQIRLLFRVRSNMNFMRIVCGESFWALGTSIRAERFEKNVLRTSSFNEKIDKGHTVRQCENECGP